MSTPKKLIFLPGAGGNPAFWQPASDLLAHPASRCLLGWPGFGVAPADPGIEGMDGLVALVLDQIDRPCALIAQSMGGVVAVLAALKRPDLVSHLVLAVTSGGVDMADLRAEDWRSAFLAANPTVPRWLTDYRSDLSDAIKTLRAPTLLLWGDADTISPVAVGVRLHGLLPESSLHVIAGGGHDLANRLAATVAPLIDAHLVSANNGAPGVVNRECPASAASTQG
ncbi:alpha/beta hydrolase [Massilia violaceinigra]|uniref:Alpha/beta hydrolase n=1 Tax=Massilia violaceinigra TaxID=2045208 RepID=A0A2D2DFJ5_9BURK|nr:alpha/beta hydrolase [Massilia violaceinigra]ATQ73735.1 alpha/beta hydrolase [Massilia violaceinigra]